MLGDGEPVSGIYEKRARKKDIISQRMNFYPYVITRTTEQQERRDKFKNAVSAWQSLTTLEQAVYNERARNKNFFGYHLLSLLIYQITLSFFLYVNIAL
jgi:hypothetical protein